MRRGDLLRRLWHRVRQFFLKFGRERYCRAHALSKSAEKNHGKIRQDMKFRSELVEKAGLEFRNSTPKGRCRTEWTENQIQVAFGNGCKCLIQER